MSLYFKKLESMVNEIVNIDIKKNLINKITLNIDNKIYIVETLEKKNLSHLFEYFNSFTNEEKEYFGYPLFRPINKSYLEFSKSYYDWLVEKDNWNVFMLYEKYCEKVIAVSYIKKINFKNSENEEFKSPTWFNSVRSEFRSLRFKNNKLYKLSYLMGFIVILQAEYKNLKYLYGRGRQNNPAVNKYHMALGFKKTGRNFTVKTQNFSFNDTEYILEL